MFDPVEEKVGTTPVTGTLDASRNVMVMVEVATPSAVMLLVAEIVEFAATAGPCAKITEPPLIASGVSIESVFVSAVVEVSVQVESPLLSVLEQAP